MSMARRGVRLWVLVPLCVACGDNALTLPASDDERVFADHRETDARFISGSDTLSGTLYLPPGVGPFAATAINPGSSWTTRATWDEVAFFVTGLNAAVFSYDKRGQGASGGLCCPTSETETFNLLAEDLVAATRMLRANPTIDASRVGVFGSSQGGWVVPLAATAAPQEIRFALISVGGAVSTGQEGLYDQLTGYDVCQRTAPSLGEIIAVLQLAGPSGFDPRISLEAMTQPALFLYGGNDMSHPTDLAVMNLEAIQATVTKDWTTIVFPTANHDLIDQGDICQTAGPLVDVLTPISAWLDAHQLGG